MEIFIDESGFTGDDLMNSKQEYFVISSVNTTETEAEVFLESIRHDYKLQGTELKGKNLVKHKKGQNALLKVIQKFGPKSKIIFYNKKYTLACKLYEYLFEPLLTDNNSVFYKLNFHLFIADLLYSYLITKSIGTEKLFNQFQNMIINNDESFFDKSENNTESGLLIKDIRKICNKNIDLLKGELQEGGDYRNWTLETSFGSTYNMLSYWGEQYPQLKVISDTSAPLKHYEWVFNKFVGKTRASEYIDLPTGRFPATFNMSEQIKFVDSKTSNAIQIADLISSTYYQTLVKPSTPFLKKFRKCANDSVLVEASLSPLSNIASMDEKEFQRGCVILKLIVESPIQNKDISKAVISRIPMTLL